MKRATRFLICISLLLILFSALIILSFSNETGSFYESMFSVSASIITIIFTISLTLIGIQYYVQNIPYELLEYFLKSKFTISMFGVYIGSIVFNLLMLSLGINTILWLIVSITLSIICMAYLLSYFYHLVGSLQEINILNLITKDLSKKTFRQNYGKYEALKDLIIKSIKDNKNSLYKKSLSILFKKELYFLFSVNKKEISEEYTYNQRHSDVEEIILFFLNFQKQVFYELMENKRQLFLYPYIEFMKELQKASFVLLSPRPYYELRDHFNKIGDKILENKFDEVYLFYAQKLSEITQYEYDKTKKEKMVSYYDFNKRDKNETELQREELVLTKMMYDGFEQERLKFLTGLSKKAIQENVDTLNWFPKSILCDILNKARKPLENKGIGRILIPRIIYLLKQIHEENIKKSNFDSFFQLGLHWYLKPMEDLDEINELGSFITREYCLAQLNLIKINPQATVRDLGEDGRFLKDEDKNNEIIKLLMETFDQILNMMSKKKIISIDKDYVSYEIYSILGKSEKNNKLVRAIIKKHKLKQGKKVYMLGVYMSKKKDLQKKK